MKADDPRHGTNAGYKAGCRETCCRAGSAEYEQRRTNDRYLGRLRTRPTLGFRRRYEALRALGWASDMIADEIGIDYRNLPRMVAGRYVYERHHQAMVALYERLSMTVPDDRWANRRRSLALRKGYAPPLAWDDIDTDEAPATPDEHRRDTLAEFEWLTSFGESDEQAARQLGITLDAIEMARIRARKDAA